jgi:hypothetical protein
MDLGWTLEQVDALTMEELQEYYAVRDGLNKGRNSLFLKKRRK